MIGRAFALAPLALAAASDPTNKKLPDDIFISCDIKNDSWTITADQPYTKKGQQTFSDHQDLRLRALSCNEKVCDIEIARFRSEESKYQFINQYTCHNYLDAKVGNYKIVFDDLKCAYDEKNIVISNKSHTVPQGINFQSGYILNRSTGNFSGYSNVEYSSYGQKMMSVYFGACSKGNDVESVKKF